MLKLLVNHAEFQIRLISETPLLIKSGVESAGQDVKMAPVLTRRGDSDTPNQPYIPGSSAKGVLRSHAERIGRTLAGSAADRRICDPFAKDGPSQSCSSRLQQRKLKKGEEVYAASCPVCRLFGCLSLQSRLSVSDFYALIPADQPTIERRDGVGIDRVTGGASGKALFNLAAAVGGKYTGTIRVRNFELWQLGLLAFVLRDLREGVLSFGMGQSRGLGSMHAELQAVTLRFYGQDYAANRLTGLAPLASRDHAFDAYGFSSAEAERSGVAAGMTAEDDETGMGRIFRYSGADVTTLLRTVAPVWPAYMHAPRGEGR